MRAQLSSETALRKLVFGIYDRFDAPDFLLETAGFLQESLNQAQVGLWCVTHAGEIVEGATTNESINDRERYLQHYSTLNPIMPLAAPLLRDGVIVQSSELIADREYKKTEFYQEYVRPRGYLHETGRLIRCGSGASLVVSLGHGKLAQRLVSAELHNFEYLCQAIRHAMQLRDRSVAPQPHSQEWIELNNQRRLMNNQGYLSSYLFETGALHLSSREVIARSVELDSLISRTLFLGDCWDSQLLAKGVNITADADRLSVNVTRTIGGGCRIDLAITATPSRHLIRHLFAQERLTNAEAGVLQKLMASCSVRQAADELGVSYQTARSHLRNVMSKLNVGTQRELLALTGDRIPGKH